jgi:hypothetical protein
LSQINQALYRRSKPLIASKTRELKMSDGVKNNLKNQSTWKRGLYMLLFSFLSRIAEVVLFGVVVLQFILKLLTDNTNERLCKLGQGISTYLYQIFQYLSFNSEYQPYPFGAWPKGEPKTQVVVPKPE